MGGSAKQGGMGTSTAGSGVVGGNSVGLSRQPSARASMQHWQVEHWQIAGVVDRTTPGYSSETVKKIPDPN